PARRGSGPDRRSWSNCEKSVGKRGRRSFTQNEQRPLSPLRPSVSLFHDAGTPDGHGPFLFTATLAFDPELISPGHVDLAPPGGEEKLDSQRDWGLLVETFKDDNGVVVAIKDVRRVGGVPVLDVKDNALDQEWLALELLVGDGGILGVFLAEGNGGHHDG